MMTKYNIEISNRLYYNRLGNLINQFYKILPIKESGEPTLEKYMEGLLRELLGTSELIEALEYDAQYMSLVAILQYMIDHECDVSIVRSDVFKAIGILKRMREKYTTVPEGEQDGRVG